MSTTSYVVTLEFTDGPPAEEHRTAQRRFLAGLLDQGTLRAAGVFADKKGGMSVLTADSLEDAQKIFAESPFAQAQVVDWDVREWTITWGDL